MKKIISVILAVIMMFSVTAVAFAAEDSSFGAYKRVFIIGVDGVGNSFGKFDCPNFDRIFENGAYNNDADTEFVTVSAQNWGSILCGVSYLKHGFTNESLDKNERDSSSDNNSIFYYVRQAMPDAKLVSFNNWTAINHGIIETDIGVEKINPGNDDDVTEAILDYYNAGNDSTLMFVQLDNVDHEGHTYGRKSDNYKNGVIKADSQIGMIYDCLDENGLLEDALFIVVGDHGHTLNGGHGGRTYDESHTVVAVAGKTVNKSALDGAKNRDVAAIALYALGVEIPSHMTAEVPADLFVTEGEAENGGESFIDKLIGKLRDFWAKVKAFFENIFKK